MTLVLTTDVGPPGGVLDILTPAQSSTRQRAQTLDSSLVANVSSVAGGTVTAALETLNAAIRPPTGYISRRVFVNAASTFIGQQYAGVTAEAAITFTTAAQLAALGNRFVVDVFGPASGSGSGNGRVNATANCPGGSGSGGAAHNQQEYSLADLIAALPIVITAPLGATGGASVQAVGVATSVAGNVGNVPAGPASFGNLCTAFTGGAGGAANNNVSPICASGGAGGGILGAGQGQDVGTNTIQRGGAPASIPSASGSAVVENANVGWGGAHATSANPASGSASVWGGASGGSGHTNQGAGGQGGDSVWGCAAGAGAPNRNTLTAGPINGSPGGCSNSPINTTRAAGGLGADGAGTQTAQDGAPGATGVYPAGGNGGGSGGDARSTTAVTGVANGGRGGDGGFPGGGAGAGGPGLASVAATANSGPGAKGGDSCVVLTGYI